MTIPSTARRFLVIATAVLATGSITACTHNGPDVYDTSSNRTRHWDRNESAAYVRWEQERRISHVEYSRRQAEEQRQYWEWRRDHQ